MKQVFMFIAISCMLLVSSCPAITITVDDDGPADFTTVQAAIDYAVDGDVVVVQPGTYAETISFAGKAITVRSTAPEDWDIVAATVLSSSQWNMRYTVVFEWGETTESVLAGFTITQLGILCYDTSPTITQNIIENCVQWNYQGGGIAGVLGATPNITHNIIRNNLVNYTAESSGSFAGGGAIGNCHGLIANNIILNNSATADVDASVEGPDPAEEYSLGGALYNCDGRVINNIIAGNMTETNMIFHVGGGISITTQSPGSGGGLYACGGNVRNNIIAYNVATNGGAIYGLSQNSYNTYFRNMPPTFADGATAGLGDKEQNPLFADEGNPSGHMWSSSDLHLKSEAGRWDSNLHDWVFDTVTSPCIDAGDPADGIGVEPNPNGDRINIGAYGGTSEASKSPSGEIRPVCHEPLTMDANRDCKVDMTDFAEFASQWMLCGLDVPDACWQPPVPVA